MTHLQETRQHLTTAEQQYGRRVPRGSVLRAAQKCDEAHAALDRAWLAHEARLASRKRS